MTHAQLAQKLRLNSNTYTIIGIILLTIAVVSFAGNYILSTINNTVNVRIIYSTNSLGLALVDQESYSPWNGQLGMHSLLPFCGFVTGITFAAEFRAGLGSGLTRRAIWFDNLRDLVIIMLMLTSMLFISAAILSFIETPNFVAGSDNLWLAIVMIGGFSWMMALLGYLVSIAYVRLHWAIPTIGIVAFLVLTSQSTLLNSLPDSIRQALQLDQIHGLQFVFWAVLSAVILGITFLLIRTLPMRRH